MIGGVTDASEAFADLVRLKRQLYDLDAQHTLWCTTLPPALEMTDDQHARMRETQAEMTELAVQIHRHEAFKGLDQMEYYALNREASKQARASDG